MELPQWIILGVLLLTAVAGLSHDLRTPLTALIGYLDLLEQEENGETVRRYLSQIRNRTEALKDLMEELFQYSVATSSQELHPEPVDMVGALILAALLKTESILLFFVNISFYRHILSGITFPF